LFWLDHYHIDGLRVDAVASMLYLDYSREDGEWIPNKYGGRENIDAIEFLKKFNYFVHDQYPGCLTFAEESTSWGGVTAPVQQDGLGFDYKWNMGWMNDTLSYIEKDPIYRRYHQGELTFSMVYAFSEQFILPFSHDEVVHMKKSMLSKMPGDDWQKFANLRLLYTYMYAHPGAKLLFMGSEFGQWGEWNDAQSLDWHLCAFEPHQQLQTLIKDLNHLHQNQASLYELDTDWRGFEWIDFHDADNSLISFVRKAKDSGDFVVVVLNFTPNVLHNYRVGVPEMGNYEVLFNSDSEYYGGSNVGAKECSALAESSHNFSASISLDIPPLAGIMLKLKN
jgi:1,4-alpha-glucan branching enzyme